MITLLFQIYYNFVFWERKEYQNISFMNWFCLFSWSNLFTVANFFVIDPVKLWTCDMQGCFKDWFPTSKLWFLQNFLDNSSNVSSCWQLKAIVGTRMSQSSSKSTSLKLPIAFLRPFVPQEILYEDILLLNLLDSLQRGHPQTMVLPLWSENNP